MNKDLLFEICLFVPLIVLIFAYWTIETKTANKVYNALSKLGWIDLALSLPAIGALVIGIRFN